MSGLLEKLWYKIQDRLGEKTYAESQAEKYQNAVEELESRLKKLEELPEIIEKIKTDYECMEKNSSSAKGKFSDIYIEKEEQNRTSVENVEQYYRLVVSEMENQYREAQRQYEYWSEETEREDREMKIYEKQYYEELEREQNRN